MKHLDLRVTGRVQGVSFRYYTKLKADSLGLGGWVRNETDGSVTIAVEGDDNDLATMKRWIEQGPRSAVVKTVQATEGEIEGYTSFAITL